VADQTGCRSTLEKLATCTDRPQIATRSVLRILDPAGTVFATKEFRQNPIATSAAGGLAGPQQSM
jgi:hypothetical protein